MPGWLVFPLVLAVGFVAVTVVPRLLVRHRRRVLERGDDAVFRVRLAGTRAPYPQTPRRGVLRLGPQTLTWTGRAGGPALDLAPSGIGGLRSRLPRRGDRAGQDDVVLTAADGLGVPLRLVGRAETIEQLDELLRARPAPEHPRPPTVLRKGRPRLLLGWPLAVGAVGIAGLALTALAVSTGVPVTGTVVSEPDADDYCDVRWTDPRDGAERTNGVDCYDDVGDRVDLIALAGPLRGEVVASEDPWFWGVVSGLLVASGVGGALWRARDRRRDEQAAPAPTDAPPPPPEIGADQLGWDEVAAAMRVRARAEGWAFDPDPDAAEPQDWPTRSPRTLLLTRLGLALAPLLFAAFLALLVGWTSFAGVWATAGETRTVEAQVTDEYLEGAVPFGPGDVEVTFPLEGGGRETTLVSVRGLPEPAPSALPVAYSTADPDRARALRYDGAARGTGLGAAALLAGLAWSGWRLAQVLRDRRAGNRALEGPARQVRYVLVPDIDSEVVLLLWDGFADRPAHALALVDDPRGRLPGAGTVEVRGRYAAGEVVAARAGERTLLLASPLLEVEEDEVLDLVNLRLDDEAVAAQ